MVILANVGVPMIFIHWPLMIGALIPVIVIESLLIRRWIPLSYREAFAGCSAANAYSTFVGVPLAWAAMFALELLVMMPVAMAADTWHWNLDSPIFYVLGFFFGMAWLVPAEQYLHWLVPLAVAVLLIPCFYASVWLERRTCRRMWPSHDPAAVSKAVFRANLASYALLFSLACGWVAFSAISGKKPGSKHVAVSADIQVINTQLEAYKRANFFFPTSEQGLQALVSEPTNDPKPPNWHQLFRSLPKDPWQDDYIYRCPGTKNPRGYDLFSAGPDGKPDTADDDWGG